VGFLYDSPLFPTSTRRPSPLRAANFFGAARVFHMLIPTPLPRLTPGAQWQAAGCPLRSQNPASRCFFFWPGLLFLPEPWSFAPLARPLFRTRPKTPLALFSSGSFSVSGILVEFLVRRPFFLLSFAYAWTALCAIPDASSRLGGCYSLAFFFLHISLFDRKPIMCFGFCLSQLGSCIHLLFHC